MLLERRQRILNDVERLENGLIRLRETSKSVAKLQDELVQTQKIVEIKRADAEALLERVGRESAIGTAVDLRARLRSHKPCAHSASGTGKGRCRGGQDGRAGRAGRPPAGGLRP
jgi:hypothetical protein